MPVDSGNVIAGRRVQLLSADDIVDIAHGGTGASDAASARDNLAVPGILVDNGDSQTVNGVWTFSGSAFFAGGSVWIDSADGVTPPKLLLGAQDAQSGGEAFTLQPEVYPTASPVINLMLQAGTLIPRVAKVDLTAQTASIGSTNLLVAPTAGMYEVKIVQEDTTASAAGTLTTTIGWTGRGGAQTFTTAATVLTGLGGIPVPPLLIYIASGNLTYLTTLAGVVGSPQYSLGISVERLF